jgi:hypothetical protein
MHVLEPPVSSTQPPHLQFIVDLFPVLPSTFTTLFTILPFFNTSIFIQSAGPLTPPLPGYRAKPGHCEFISLAGACQAHFFKCRNHILILKHARPFSFTKTPRSPFALKPVQLVAVPSPAASNPDPRSTFIAQQCVSLALVPSPFAPKSFPVAPVSSPVPL